MTAIEDHRGARDDSSIGGAAHARSAGRVRRPARRVVWMLVGALATIALATGCGRAYSGQIFDFPPESDSSTARYELRVVWSSSAPALDMRSTKDVAITVRDNKGLTVLDDKLQLECASIDATVMWTDFGDLKVRLLEEGNEFATDNYNRALLQSGPPLSARSD